MLKYLEYFEAIYYISGPVLVIGLLFAFRQVKIASENIKLAQEQLKSANEHAQIASRHLGLLKKDMNDRHRRASVEKSLEYLSMYAYEIIPQTSKYTHSINEELKEEPRSIYSKDNNGFKINPENLKIHQIREIIVKQENGLVHIINKLEVFSVAILNGLADEKIIYTPIARIFCDLIEKEYLYISVTRYEGVPYENLIKLYNKWLNAIELEELTLQSQDIQDKMKDKQDSHEETITIGSTS